MYINKHLSANIGLKIVNVIHNDRLFTSDYQFLLIQKGTIKLELDSVKDKYILQKDDIILIPPKLSFICSPITSNTVIGIRIDVPYFNSIIEPGYFIECNSTLGPKKKYMQLYQILIQICSNIFSNDNDDLMAASIYQLTACLKEDFIHKKHLTELSDIEMRNQERISTITSYVNNHYHQSLPLCSLADKMFLSPQYLSKFFKKNFGTTYSKYLTNIRLQHAHTELIETENSITNIALNNGFPTIAAFNKAFREVYSISPSTYRHNHPKRDNFVPVNEDYDLREDIINPSILNIHATSENIMPYCRPWLDTVNIGSLSDALNISFHSSFLEYQKKIGIKYVRCCNIFSEDIMYLDPETQEFDFTNLNEVLDFFYDAKVIPFMELSFKPHKNHVVLSEDNEKELFKNEKDISYYYSALRAMLKHCIDCYGLNYLVQWRFEVWAKHEENLFYSETPSAYVKKYMGFYKIIKEFLPMCQIGGPGFNICGDINVFTSFLTTFHNKNVPFDFISLNAFSYEMQLLGGVDDAVNYGILSPDPDHIYNVFHKYRVLLDQSDYSKLPVYITEFGSLLSFQNYITDSVFQAAFLCKNMLDFTSDSNCIAYHNFYDNSSQFAPADFYYPASGLITENGIPKPCYYAYSFLARLGKNLVSQGDHYIMTCNSQNQYQLLFYNYVHFSKGFCFNSWDQIHMENTYEVFEDTKDLNIHFICKDIPIGRYKVTRYSLNRNYGSALDKYLRILDAGNITSAELLSTILNLREDEAKYYKQTSIPRQDIYYINCEEYLDLTIELAAHEIVFFELVRIL